MFTDRKKTDNLSLVPITYHNTHTHAHTSCFCLSTQTRGGRSVGFVKQPIVQYDMLVMQKKLRFSTLTHSETNPSSAINKSCGPAVPTAVTSTPKTSACHFVTDTQSMSSVCRADKRWQSVCLRPSMRVPTCSLYGLTMKTFRLAFCEAFLPHLLPGYCKQSAAMLQRRLSLCLQAVVCNACTCSLPLSHQWNVITMAQTKKRSMQCVVLHLWSSGNDPRIVLMCMPSSFGCYLDPFRDVWVSICS